MDELRDIYKKADDSGETQKVLPSYELTPDEMRSRVRKQVVSLTVIMLVLLGGAVSYFYSQEADYEDNELLLALKSPIPTNKPSMLIPEPDVTLADLDVPTAAEFEQEKSAERDISPQKMSEAMGEIRIASEAMKQRDWDAAEERLRKALAIWPDMNVALRLMGHLYTQRGQFDQAIVIFERARKGDPFNAEIYNNLAAAFLHKRAFERAEELLTTALQIRPGFAPAHLNMGLLYLVWGRYDQAIEHFQNALVTMPSNPSLLNNMGVAMLRTGRYDEAREQFKAIIDRSVDASAAYFNMAITYALEGDPAEAMEWIKRGATHCSPAVAQGYLKDSDFDSLRGMPEFQSFVRDMYPDLPRGPQGT